MAALIANLIGIFYTPNPRSRVSRYNLPLPTVCHQVLEETVIGNRHVFVIGDVHGCFDEMNAILNKAAAIDSDIVIIFAGDMINKGPKSVEVIRKIRQMSNTFAVRGNHEERILQELRSLRDQPDFKLRTKYEWIRGLNDEDVEYINELPYTITVPCLKMHVVHGGIVPGRPLAVQILNDLTNMRNVINVSELFFGDFLIASVKHSQGRAWASVWAGPYHVYFGHDAKRSLQRETFATGLDTGCVYGRALTGVFVNGCKLELSVQAFSSGYKSE